MSKNKHHYVPQFYLRLFASDRHLSKEPKRIHLFNIKNDIIRENVSIKDQCYERKFYGKTDEIENALAAFEGASSWLLSKIIKLEQLPPKNLPVYKILLTFVLVQHLRTKHYTDLQNEMWDGFWKAVLEDEIERFTADDWMEVFGDGTKPPTKDELKNYKIGLRDPAIFYLSLANDEIRKILDDLEAHLVLLSCHRHFVVSDNPVVAYNQYFQWLKEMSNSGLASKGIQIFLPLSPHCLLILFDKNIYHIAGNQKITRDITEKDLRTINLLQYVNADQNLYFDSAEQSNDIQKMHTSSKRFRKGDKAKTLTFDRVKTSSQKGESVLFVSFTQTSDIHLDLSFMKLKRSAKKITLRERLNSRYRKEIPDDSTNYAPPPDIPEKFVRRRDKEN